MLLLYLGLLYVPRPPRCRSVQHRRYAIHATATNDRAALPSGALAAGRCTSGLLRDHIVQVVFVDAHGGCSSAERRKRFDGGACYLQPKA